MRLNLLISALVTLPFILSSCTSDSAEKGTEPNPDLTDNGKAAKLSCQAVDVLHTGLFKGDILDARIKDGSFYIAGQKSVSRVPLNGSAHEIIITYKDEARAAALTPRGVVTIPYSGVVRYIDYAGGVLGEWAFNSSTTRPVYDAVNGQLLLITVAEKIRYDAIELETQTRQAHEVSDPSGGWATLFAGTDSDDWLATAGYGAVYLEHNLDDGKISRISLTAKAIGRFVPELPEADVKGFAGGATYVWTGNNRKTEVIELYRVEASGAIQTVSALHNQKNLTIAIMDGFDDELYYRLDNGIYLVAGTGVARIGSMEPECQRDGFLMEGSQYYAFLHVASSGTSTETVIMKLKP
jgi:hypothetical protein